MIQGLIGKKIGMTQIFDKDGNIIPVTVVKVGPCTVLELKENPRKVKIGFGEIKESKVKKPLLGFFKKIALSPMKVIREFHSADNKDYQVGQELKSDFFKPGDYVDLIGTTIGKGFQGGMKRWNWVGGPGSHGSMHHRRIGSAGASSDPSKVLKGQNMPGHMGARSMKIQGLRVMEVDNENNVVFVKGAIPGHRNAIVSILRSKKKAFKSLDEKQAVVKHKVNPMKQSKAAAKGKAKA
ncbi:MAG: 50S ribosomal protein L3 [Candidatus Omnitrophica bacterium]|nr:50S ribosomal protein L3 [Candidatus Omnitrophota bacterium]